MNDYSAKTRLETEISDAGPGMDAPLWLLQKDDTRMLYLSFFLSVTVHIILFVVMAATHIFHPFTGTSHEFDLIWFSPSPVTSPMVSTSTKPSTPKVSTARKAPPTASKPATIVKVKAETQPPSPAGMTTTPANSPSQASPASAQVQTSKEVPIEEPSEMVISRFGGKVVDVIDKKANVPTFTVISSVKMKSKTARAVVKTIHETVKETPKTRESIPKEKPSEGTMVASLPKEGPTEKQEEKGSVSVPQAKQTSKDQNVIKQQPIQGKISSSTIAATPQQSVTHPSVNRSINSFAAALEALSSSGSKLAAKEQASPKQVNSEEEAQKRHQGNKLLPRHRPPPDRPLSRNLLRRKLSRHPSCRPLPRYFFSRR